MVLRRAEPVAPHSLFVSAPPRARARMLFGRYLVLGYVVRVGPSNQHCGFFLPLIEIVAFVPRSLVPIELLTSVQASKTPKQPALPDSCVQTMEDPLLALIDTDAVLEPYLTAAHSSSSAVSTMRALVVKMVSSPDVFAGKK